MELTPEFRKDLSSNYMVLRPLETEKDSFLIKMLARNHIDGLLKIEVKMIDNQKYYYYDITGKQTLSDIIQASPISFLQLQKIYGKLLQLPDICKEFLIYENGILMEPNFIYMDTSWNIIEFCYYPGRNKELQEQVGEITEYLLNRVDYKDEKAVLAVYAFYQVSHDKSCTLEKLKKVFERQCGKESTERKERKEKERYKEKRNLYQENEFINIEHLERKDRDQKEQLFEEENLAKQRKKDEDMKSRIKWINEEEEFYERKKTMGIEGKKEDEKMKQRQSKEKREEGKKKQEQMWHNTKNENKSNMQNKKEKSSNIDFPYMEERIESQKEVLKYPKKVYFQAAFILFLGLVILFVLIKTGMLSVNGKPDSKRCIMAVVCYISILGIAFLIIFRKEKRCTEIEETMDYIDWEEDYDSLPMPELYGLTVSEPIEDHYYQDAFLKETGKKKTRYRGEKEQNDIDIKMERDDMETETELLVDFSDNSVAYLESEFSGERIYLKKFPFLIGKLRKSTDYVLENNKISRIHAKFDYDESHYYIEDMDSTNGTSLNGTALLAHDRKRLSNGDRICFADKNFIFRC